MLKAFFLAMQFLTRLPTPEITEVNNSHMGASVLFYPWVGLIIGFLLVLVAVLAQDLNPPVLGALVLSFWVMVTGGLHLDGLADCADAWAGGLANRERSLEIMKDPASGPIAVVVLILVLLLKWTALTAVLKEQNMIMLLIIPVIGRSAILAAMVSTPYIRNNGLGEKLQQNLPLSKAVLLVFLSSLLCIFVVGFLPVVIAALVVWQIRRLSLKRLGGSTGDVFGAIVELSETVVLVSISA